MSSAIDSDSDRTTTTIRVIKAVANVLGVEPMDLDPPLGTVLDPDALDILCRTDGHSSVSVQFQYVDCNVTVEDGDVVVENPLTLNSDR
ncbi:HalOD1 output domain-containing protein [Haladaptatus halobius]|uniref:HalOD1 output domain-containing protein n=1 Tax=Haladaptatus halobius TaxID=2884875 RepID=UPI001D0AC48B|nr:HalOD1 output domain-containing protein [Haladaptatus halobius]